MLHVGSLPVDLLVNIRQVLRINSSLDKAHQPVAVPSPGDVVNVHKRSNVEATLEPSLAVLVIACDRENYVRDTLDTLLK